MSTFRTNLSDLYLTAYCKLTYQLIWFIEFLIYVFGVLQALIAPDFKTFEKMPAYKDMLVSAVLFAVLGLTQCQKLPSKFWFFHTYLMRTAYLL